jgi:hypothetical protein
LCRSEVFDAPNHPSDGKSAPGFEQLAYLRIVQAARGYALATG